VSYRIVRFLWRIALRTFFRRVETHGIEAIGDGPVLIVSNHTNAFIDGVLLVTSVRRRLTLTAKRTLRKDPLLAVLIRALDVVLLSRAGDNEANAAAHNRRALEGARRVLERGGALCVFPEGISHSDPSVRPFRSGAARIALDYAAANPGTSLRIVPLGLHYTNKGAFRSEAAIIVGDAIALDAWLAANSPDAAALTALMEARVRGVTTNFADAAERRLLTDTAAIVMAGREAPVHPGTRPLPHMADLVALIHRLQRSALRVASAMPAQSTGLAERIRAHHRKLARLGITPGEVNSRIHAGRAAFFVLREVEVLLVGMPMALWGTLNHLAPYHATRLLVRRLSKDEDHFATNAIFFGLPIFLLCALLQGVLVGVLTSPLWAILYLASLPLCGTVALLYRDRSGGVYRRVRTFLMFLRHPDHQRRLLAEAAGIIADLRRMESELVTT
jgi:glycerol-3-phosphate O-acyltransferase/dihydroxyacetone phosphate acyltransferase